MKLRRLLDAFHARNLRQHLRQQAQLIEQFESAASSALGENFGELVVQAFRGNHENFGSEPPNGCGSLGLDREMETRREAYSANEAQLVFFEAALGIANGANNSRAQIGPAVNVVENFVRARIEQQTIDGEIAPQYVFFRRRRENHAVRMPPIGIACIGTKSGDFDLRSLLGNENHAELRTNRK